jgi:hypothetical protein
MIMIPGIRTENRSSTLYSSVCGRVSIIWHPENIWSRCRVGKSSANANFLIDSIADRKDAQGRQFGIDFDSGEVGRID